MFSMMMYIVLLVVASTVHVHVVHAQSIIYECDYFSTYDICDDGDSVGTNNAMMNYGSCFFSACGGNDVVISNYQNCDGNTVLRLYKDGAELSRQDDVYWDYDNMDNCSEISFSIPNKVDCQRYESRVGCMDMTNCSAQVSINVTEVNANYVRDVIKSPEGETWHKSCPGFNLTGSEISFDPSQTAVCSFELCPGEYYRAFIRDCQKNAEVDLFSYSDVQYSNYNLACEDDEDNDKVANLYFDTIGHESCQLFSFYSFCNSNNPEERCSGQVVLSKFIFPTVNITWSEDSLNAEVGDELKFTLTDMTIDENYWDFGEVSFWVVLYKTDMFENQEYCGFRDYSNYNFFDYVGEYFEWEDLEGDEFTIGDYHIDDFGGEYTVALYAWGDAYHAATLLATSESLKIAGKSGISLTLHEYDVEDTGEQLINGAWRFTNDAQVEDGDMIVVVPVDHRGYCSVHGDVGTYEAAIFVVDVGTDNKDDSSGSFDFSIPHCEGQSVHNALYQEPSFEVRYYRNNEVIGRVLAANASVVPEYIPEADDSNSSPFDTVGLEHLFIFIGIIAVIAFASAYYTRSRRAKSESYLGLDCFSVHDDEDDEVITFNQL